MEGQTENPNNTLKLDDSMPDVVELPMGLVTQIVQLINNMPYGQVAPIANDLGQCIMMAREKGKTAH